MKSQALLLALASMATVMMAACQKDQVAATQPAPVVAKKNLIFFLGDGYGMVPMTASRIYAVGEAGQLPIDTFPETAFVKTYSNDAQVTDSAPSMSAYMTGVKANNDVISMSPDTAAYDSSGNFYVSGADSTCTAGNGSPVTTLLELFKASGRGTGVVTTTRITHATPAATYSHICQRDGENNIAAQAVPGGAGYNSALGSDGIDVLLGGGFRHFLPNKNADGSANSNGLRTDGRDLTAEMKAKGYTYVTKGSDLAAVPSTTSKLLGLFTKSHMDFDLDRTDNKLDQPSLSDMTSKALDILGQKPSGFFLMVEGGRIDQALHPTNARYAMQDAKAFNDAIQTALDKMKVIDPGLANTLIVVTADHDHSMVMNGYAALTGKTIDAAHPGVLGLMRNFSDAQNADGSYKDLATVTPANDADGKPFTTLVFGNGENRVAGGRAAMTALTDATVFDKAYHQEAAIPRAAGDETHGGADVFLGAMGLGADNFHGVMDNTKVFALCKKALGL
jgi:alkaline phosphatase